MPGEFLHLEKGDRVLLAPLFLGPWDSAARTVVEDANPLDLTQDRRETAAYVIDGKGELEVNGQSFPLERGSAAMLLKGSNVRFVARPQLELLFVSLSLGEA
jgi:5-keto 4-deoxyuronate isomerase